MKCRHQERAPVGKVSRIYYLVYEVSTPREGAARTPTPAGGSGTHRCIFFWFIFWEASHEDPDRSLRVAKFVFVFVSIAPICTTEEDNHDGAPREKEE